MVILHTNAFVFITSHIAIGIINIVKPRGITIVKTVGVFVAIGNGLQLVAVVGVGEVVNAHPFSIGTA